MGEVVGIMEEVAVVVKVSIKVGMELLEVIKMQEINSIARAESVVPTIFESRLCISQRSYCSMSSFANTVIFPGSTPHYISLNFEFIICNVALQKPNARGCFITFVKQF